MNRSTPRIVRLLIKLYPEHFRHAHGDELIDFIEEDAAQQPGGLVAHARFWIRTSIDLARGAVRAWRNSPSPPQTSQPKYVLASDWIREIRFSARALVKTPLVTLVIVATLGLGVGLNTAIFSVVHAVLLEPLPYDEPDELYFLSSEWKRDGGVIDASHAGGDFAAFRRESTAFSDLAAATSIRQNLTDSDRPRQVQVGWASTNLFTLLGVEPILGAGFVDDSPAGTLVLSYEIWRDRYGSSADVLGETVRLDDHPYTIAGVLPPGFQLLVRRFPSQIDVWKTPDDWWQNGDLWNSEGVEFALLDVIARLDDAATQSDAEREMRDFARAHREANVDYERADVRYEAIPLHETIASDVRATLLVLLGAVGLVLLIACGNVMNLMLARAVSRQKEIAVRLALGATRARIATSLLTESAVLAALGGVAGVVVAVLAMQAFAAFRPTNVPRLDGVSLSGPVLGFALVAALGSVILFGLVPAIAAARGRIARDAYATRSAARGQSRLSRGLVVAQLSLSLVLLIGAGLLTKSLYRLNEVSPGFDPNGVLTFAVSLPGTKYERPEGTDRFLRELEERVESLPGASRAGVVWPMPLSGRAWANTYAGGVVRDAQRTFAHYRLVTSDYFDTLAIPLVDGRLFASGDARHVAVINQRVAERAWPGERAIGRTLRANPWGGGEEEFEIIGVVGDVRYSNLREPARDTIYFDSRGWSWTDWEVDVVVRATGNPEALIEPIRDEIGSMDAAIPMARVRTMESYLDAQLADSRFASRLVGLFAVTAGLLAALGLYGVLSYSVGRSNKEIGLRMALGAGKARILSWFLGQGVVLIGAGVALGLIGAVGITRVLSTFLFGVSATDPWTFAAVVGGLTVVGAAAAALPAHRATSVDPNDVLRTD